MTEQVEIVKIRCSICEGSGKMVQEEFGTGAKVEVRCSMCSGLGYHMFERA